MTEGEALIALMEQDRALDRAAKMLDELPEKQAILKLRHRLKEIEVVADKARSYLKTASAMVARAADEVALVDAKIETEQAKVLSGSVTDSKELQNLTREIASLGRRKDQLEREELNLMEKAETGEAQVARVEATLAEGHKKERSLISSFKARGGEMQTEIARLKAEREAIAGKLDAKLYARYEALRASKRGLAVGVLQGSLCSACRTEIPGGQRQLLESGPEIGECPNCKRMIVVRREAE
ncbi:MAG: zinc ribbon domain-containing protein [Coriobacteriia bacterium]